MSSSSQPSDGGRRRVRLGLRIARGIRVGFIILLGIATLVQAAIGIAIACDLRPPPAAIGDVLGMAWVYSVFIPLLSGLAVELFAPSPDLRLARRKAILPDFAAIWAIVLLILMFLLCFLPSVQPRTSRSASAILGGRGATPLGIART